jgi:hypothetical protein
VSNVAAEKREITGFAVFYKEGDVEKIDHVEDTACLLMVERELGVEVRGHGSDESMVRTLDAFFNRHHDLFMKVLMLRAKPLPEMKEDEGGSTH